MALSERSKLGRKEGAETAPVSFLPIRLLARHLPTCVGGGLAPWPDAHLVLSRHPGLRSWGLYSPPGATRSICKAVQEWFLPLSTAWLFQPSAYLVL
jgi:hypothetical protein